jgi:hypothetical protein
VAVAVADWFVVIVPAVAVKVAVVAPAATVIEVGRDKRALLLDSAILAPPVGAGEDNVTVQVDATLLARLVSVQPSDVSANGGVRVKFAC